jgi:hypothetical protein
MATAPLLVLPEGAVSGLRGARRGAPALLGPHRYDVPVRRALSRGSAPPRADYLLSTQFNAWQGTLREPTDRAPIVRSAWVCALYALPATFWALTVSLRRDVTGG